MSQESQNFNDNQEIDLSQISKKIGGFFEGISNRFFRGILFVKRNLIVLSILVVVGVIAGYILDKKIKQFDHQIIVLPNFGSTDYLYSKIELINSKIIEKDTVFLRDVVGIKDAKKIKKIKITPITDVYKFIENKAENFELIKLMAEDGDIKKIIQDQVTSKNYPYHSITFTTTKLTSNEKSVKPILDYLNNSEYYKAIQKQYLYNVNNKIQANDTVIAQIDRVLNSFSNTVNSNKNDKLVYYNENSQLNDVIKTKNDLIYEQGSNRLNLINLSEIIKENSSTINIKNTDALNGNLKYVLPLLLVFGFILLAYFKKFYSKQLLKNK